MSVFWACLIATSIESPDGRAVPYRTGQRKVCSCQACFPHRILHSYRPYLVTLGTRTPNSQMSDPPTNHTTLLHPRSLLHKYYICLPSLSRHACSTWRRRTFSRSESSAHQGAGNPPSVRSFLGSTLFLQARSTETCSRRRGHSKAPRAELGTPPGRRRRTRLRGPACIGLSGKCTLERCTQRCRKRSTCWRCLARRSSRGFSDCHAREMDQSSWCRLRYVLSLRAAGELKSNMVELRWAVEWLALTRSRVGDLDVLILGASFFPSVCLYIPETDTGTQTNQRLILQPTSHRPLFLHSAHAHTKPPLWSHTISPGKLERLRVCHACWMHYWTGFQMVFGACKRCMGERGSWNWCQARYWQWCPLPLFYFL